MAADDPDDDDGATAGARPLFELELSGGPAERLHRRLVGAVESRYPFETLHPDRYPPALIERARIGWTQHAYNEYCAVAAMGELVVALARAQAPIDFWSAAARFAQEEVLHTELCARVAMRLGGGAPVAFAPREIVPEVDPTLPPLAQATELVVRTLCVAEGLSLPLLRGSMQSATHPLTKSILRTIVADEAPHARLGWLYLDWAAPAFGLAERDRLGRAARQTIEHYAELWDRLQSRVQGHQGDDDDDGAVTREGFRLAHVHELGWMESSAYAALARATVTDEILPRLAAHGIAA